MSELLGQLETSSFLIFGTNSHGTLTVTLNKREIHCNTFVKLLKDMITLVTSASIMSHRRSSEVDCLNMFIFMVLA
jgi:hypothetical protein